LTPLCVPSPTIARPSPETLLALVSVQPVRLIPRVGRYVFKSTSPIDAFHSVARSSVIEFPLNPTTTAPSLLTPYPREYITLGNAPRFCDVVVPPPSMIQRAARPRRKPLTIVLLDPATTAPSSLTASAIEPVPPGSVPRSTMPPAAVQRNASEPPGVVLSPTITDPSRLAAFAIE